MVGSKSRADVAQVDGPTGSDQGTVMGALRGIIVEANDGVDGFRSAVSKGAGAAMVAGSRANVVGSESWRMWLRRMGQHEAVMTRCMGGRSGGW